MWTRIILLNIPILIKLTLSYADLEDPFFLILVISVISDNETTLTLSLSTGEPVSMESGVVRVASLCTTEMLKIIIKKSDIQGPDT